MDNIYYISEVKKMNKTVYHAILHLLPQYSSLKKLPSYQEIEDILNSKTTRLFLAYEKQTEKIVGSLILVIFRLPSGVRSWIEEVIVDKKYRKRGIGKLLCNTAINTAAGANARTVDLTSRPIRVGANRLYKSVGFEIRNTYVYRINLTEK